MPATKEPLAATVDSGEAHFGLCPSTAGAAPDAWKDWVKGKASMPEVTKNDSEYEWVLKEEEKDERRRTWGGENTPSLKATNGKEEQKERRTRKGPLSPVEGAWARARELSRRVQPLLFPGLHKRKYESFKHNTSIGVIERANIGRLRVEKRMVEKEKKEMEKKKEKGKEPKIFIFGSCEVPESLEKKEKEKEQEKVKASNTGIEKVTYYNQMVGDTEDSEIYFRGGLVDQVREACTPPEPERISVLHWVGGVLQVVDPRVRQSLGDWFWGGLEKGERIGEEGYFTTAGGKLLNSRVPVEHLGLQPGQEVVFHRRLREGEGGGGFSGGGGARVLGWVAQIRCKQGTGPAIIVTSRAAGMHVLLVTGAGLRGIKVRGAPGR